MRCTLFLLVVMFSCGCGTRGESTGESARNRQTSSPPPASSIPSPSLEEGFKLLTLQDFVPFQGNETTWREEGNVLICSGVPKGYVHTKDAYANFTLRGDYAYEPADPPKHAPDKYNTGFMIAIQEPHKVWPASLEVQGRMDKICSINANGGIAAPQIEDHPDAREHARKPVGNWNSVEIICRDGAITARLNGELICTSSTGELKEGFLGLQSEGDVVKFRNLRVRRD
jgi:hypothetical protein